MNYLDLRGQTWNFIADNNIARFLTKSEATSFAKANGWFAKDVVKAANRFCKWWVICQMQSTSTLTFLRADGKTSETSHPGYW